MPIPAPQVKFLPLCEEMLSEFKDMHKALFPVQYGDKFYSDVLHAEQHVALIALIEESDEETDIDSDFNEDVSSSATKASLRCEGPQGDARGGKTKTSHPKIVGVASGRVNVVKGMWRERRDGYIMTLGTHNRYRGRGIASRLLTY